jgi:hypothetical protein
MRLFEDEATLKLAEYTIELVFTKGKRIFLKLGNFTEFYLAQEMNHTVSVSKSGEKSSTEDGGPSGQEER